MGTNLPSLPGRILREFERAGIDYAILHGAEQIGSIEHRSDIDIVCTTTADEKLHSLASALSETDIALIFLWVSDLGTINTFWWDRSEGAGCQIDVLHDPTGRNRFGFKTDGVSRMFDNNEWPPRVSNSLSHIYLLAKSVSKGQPRRLKELRAFGRDAPSSRHLAVRTRIALNVLRSDPAIETYGKVTKLRSQLLRGGQRLRHRQGVLVSLAPGNGQFVTSLSQVLPRVQLRTRVSSSDLARVRLLPEVVIRVDESGDTPEKVISVLNSVALGRLAARSGVQIARR